jgi:hypothetical protein
MQLQLARIVHALQHVLVVWSLGGLCKPGPAAPVLLLLLLLTSSSVSIASGQADELSMLLLLHNSSRQAVSHYINCSYQPPFFICCS